MCCNCDALQQSPMQWRLKNTDRVPPGGFRYVIPENGTVVSASNYNQLIVNVRTHYQSNRLSVPEIGTIEDWLCHQLAEPGEWCKGDDMPQRVRKPKFNGAPLWAELHQRALSLEAGADDSDWLKAFRKRVPCGVCRWGWTIYRRLHPINWHRYFEWTVEVHNHVNERIGLPVWTVEEARERWSGETAKGTFTEGVVQ